MPPKPKNLGPNQLADQLGIGYGHFAAGRAHGFIPEPDAARGKWSSTAVSPLLKRRDELAAAIADAVARQPIGAAKAAAALSDRLGRDVTYADVEQLVEEGELTSCGEFKGSPLYDQADLAKLPTDVVARVVDERETWLEDSMKPAEARTETGWSKDEFDEVAAARGIRPGRFGRYARADIAALAADEDTDEIVRYAREVTIDGAATLLEVRITDVRYCVAAGWLRPRGHLAKRVTRNRDVAVPVYLVADVMALLDIPDVDWESVRAARPGEPSPLRRFASLAIPRGTLIRGFAADYCDQHNVPITTTYDVDTDLWTLTWTPAADGSPTEADLSAALAADASLTPYRNSIVLQPTTGDTGEAA